MKPRYNVNIIKNVMIPMRDGVRLAADLFMPNGDGKFPAVLEYIPYRKDDLTSPGHSYHHYFAKRGIVGVRLDIRGTGASEGYITDEYLPIEHQDGYDAIEWLAKQDWCNGNIGMFGISYGGYTSIQVAMLQPPHLKAISPMYATDDRYTDGDQYRGGAKRGILSTCFYAASMVSMNALPPYPEYSGEDWARIWEEHLEKNTPFMNEWLGRQVDDEYWQECLGRRYHLIKCPTYIIGGWMDHFVNAMTRLYAELKIPKKLLMGPWPHMRPDGAVPGPNIDWMRETMRWFSYWLRGDETGIMNEPPVTVYVQEHSRPKRHRDITKGFWRNEDGWPPSRMKETTLYLGDEKLTDSPPTLSNQSDIYEYNPIVGLMGGPWYGYPNFVMAGDQRIDDALSICYDSQPLQNDVEILGWPQAKLYVSSTADVAFFVVRLEDLAPDGTSTLVTKGILNATRRESVQTVKPMVPGEIYGLEIQLDAASWIFEKGHKIRIAVCSSDFPDIWPSPKEAINTIYRETKHPSKITLPTLPKQRPELPKPDFQPPPRYPVTAEINHLGRVWKITEDIYDNKVKVYAYKKTRIKPLDGIATLETESVNEGVASRIKPWDVSFTATDTTLIERSDMNVEAKQTAVIKSTKTEFHQVINLQVTFNGIPHFNRKWMMSVPRNYL
jgi:putative CocE/NonD family hydrolase